MVKMHQNHHRLATAVSSGHEYKSGHFCLENNYFRQWNFIFMSENHITVVAVRRCYTFECIDSNLSITGLNFSAESSLEQDGRQG